MIDRRLLVSALLLSCFGFAVHTAQAAEKPRVLMLTESKGFKHGSVNRKEAELAPAEIAIKLLGQKTGLFDVDCTQNCEADFTKENLQK